MLQQNKNIIIRNETPADHRTVEELTKKAFWNLYVPGGSEHYLVHVIRQHQDFVPELDLMLEADGQIVGNIMYTKARLVDEQQAERVDEGFEKMEKKCLPCQEEFYILSHSAISDDSMVE